MKDTYLHVGAVLPILKRNFELLDADEFTYQYMENNRQAYPVADPTAALHVLATAIHTGALHRILKCSHTCASIGLPIMKSAEIERTCSRLLVLIKWL